MAKRRTYNGHIYETEYELYKNIVQNNIALKNKTCEITEQIIDQTGKVLIDDFSRDSIVERLEIK